MSLMTEIEKQKKRVRKNKKYKIRSDYRKIKWLVENEILNATENYAYIETNIESRLATFIVMKKLERRGYKCRLKKGDWVSTIFHNDRLFIDW